MVISTINHSYWNFKPTHRCSESTVYFTNLNCWAIQGDVSPYYDFQGSGEQGSVVMKFTQIRDYSMIPSSQNHPVKREPLHGSSHYTMGNCLKIGYLDGP